MKKTGIYISLFIFLHLILSACNHSSVDVKENVYTDTIIGKLVKGKWSLQPEKGEINIYFVGRIINFTTDTIYLSYPDSLAYTRNYTFGNSYFYTIVETDTIHLMQFADIYKIKPNDSIPIDLFQIIPLEKYNWTKNYVSILKTCTLYYSYPYYEKNKIKELIFSRTENFGLDSLPDNTFYETAFLLEEWLE